MLKSVLSVLMVFYFSIPLSAAVSIKPFINGGEKVVHDDPIAKSTVMLETDAQYCSASIVDQGLLLTAAHCLREGERWIKIHFSGLEGTESRMATRSVRHENYQDFGDTTRNDVALVFFDGHLPAGFKTVSILPAEKGLIVGEELQLAGYGGGSPLGSLAKIKLSVSQLLKDANLIQFNQTSAHGICHGDSGGPAFKTINSEIYLAAVASYAHEIDCSGYSVYTSATPYIEWIRQKQNTSQGYSFQ